MKTLACLAALTANIALAITPALADQLDSRGHEIYVSRQSGSKAATLRSLTWNRHEIPVCWIDPGAEDQAKRDRVRQAVAQSWEQVADVKFVGWGACEGEAPMVRIAVGSDEWPRAMLGTSSLSTGRPTAWLNFDLPHKDGFRGCSGKIERCEMFVATHEFGHVLGLIHEQDRPETPDSCVNRLSSGQRYTHDSSELVLLTPYDSDSLMNYCSTRGWDERRPLVLSEHDIAGVQSLFGSRPEQRPEPRQDGVDPRVTAIEHVLGKKPQ